MDVMIESDKRVSEYSNQQNYMDQWNRWSDQKRCIEAFFRFRDENREDMAVGKLKRCYAEARDNSY
jgi:hypothetical protein